MAAANYLSATLSPKPGIQRDGTRYNSKHYIDGQWMRFYNNSATKIGGTNALLIGNNEIVRNIYNITVADDNQIYLGRASSLQYFTVDFNGVVSGQIDRTPIAGFIPNPNNLWSMAQFTDTSETNAGNYIVAQVAQNVTDTTNSTVGPIFAGPTDTITPLTPVFNGSPSFPVEVSGGIVAVPPILVAYGSGGVISWTYPGQLYNWNSAFDGTGVPNLSTIANSKIIQAYPLPGATNPSVLFWTANSVIRATYQSSTDTTTGQIVGPGTWIPQTLQTNSSIMSANSVIPYNQMLFWVGVDQFYMYNGVVQNLPNTMAALVAESKLDPDAH